MLTRKMVETILALFLLDFSLLSIFRFGRVDSFFVSRNTVSWKNWYLKIQFFGKIVDRSFLKIGNIVDLLVACCLQVNY